MNTTRMHLYTHVRASMRGQSGMPDNEYADGMIEHDGDVGKLLKALDDLGMTVKHRLLNGWQVGNRTYNISMVQCACLPDRTARAFRSSGTERLTREQRSCIVCIAQIMCVRAAGVPHPRNYTHWSAFMSWLGGPTPHPSQPPMCLGSGQPVIF